jgi:hypothetical protein
VALCAHYANGLQGQSVGIFFACLASFVSLVSLAIFSLLTFHSISSSALCAHLAMVFKVSLGLSLIFCLLGLVFCDVNCDVIAAALR